MKVLLTGSSKGIGYKIAQDLLTEGHELALHYNKNESPLKFLLKEDKTGSFSIQADLYKQEDIKKRAHFYGIKYFKISTFDNTYVNNKSCSIEISISTVRPGFVHSSVTIFFHLNRLGFTP